MIRQIFIAPLKKGISEKQIQKRIEDQRRLKDHVTGIQAITVDYSLGLYGIDHAIVMTIDLKDMKAWHNLLSSDYHTQLGNEAPDYFKVDEMISVQVSL